MSAADKRCDGSAAAIFVAGLAAGTANAIFSKAMFQLRILGNTGELEPFAPKLMTTFLMFVGMSMALPAHALMPKPADAAPVSLRMLALLSVPALFDLCATALGTLGLLLLPLSMWQLLRGSVMVFVAIMKHFALGDELAPSMWCGVLIVTAAISLVGLVGAADVPSGDAALGDTLAGVLLTLSGTFVSSVQFAVEEKLMSGKVAAPPMLLVGMEGACGLMLTALVVYPIYYALPGEDHGHFEDVANTLTKLGHSAEARGMALCYTVLVFLFNVFGMQVTQRLSAVWKAILNNLRPASIWATQLVLHGLTAGRFGEAWAGDASWLQLGGLGLLVFGIAVYNGSVALPCLRTPQPLLLVAASPMASPNLEASPLLNRVQIEPTPAAADPMLPGGSHGAQALKVRLLAR